MRKFCLVMLSIFVLMLLIAVTLLLWGGRGMDERRFEFESALLQETLHIHKNLEAYHAKKWQETMKKLESLHDEYFKQRDNA